MESFLSRILSKEIRNDYGYIVIERIAFEGNIEFHVVPIQKEFQRNHEYIGNCWCRPVLVELNERNDKSSYCHHMIQ